MKEDTDNTKTMFGGYTKNELIKYAAILKQKEIIRKTECILARDYPFNSIETVAVKTEINELFAAINKAKAKLILLGEPYVKKYS